MAMHVPLQKPSVPAGAGLHQRLCSGRRQGSWRSTPGEAGWVPSPCPHTSPATRAPSEHQGWGQGRLQRSSDQQKCRAQGSPWAAGGGEGPRGGDRVLLVPSSPPSAASSGGSDPSQETASPQSTASRRCRVGARRWPEGPGRVTILSPLQQDLACGCLCPCSWARLRCSPPLRRPSARGGGRRRRGLFPNKRARSRGALTSVFAGGLGEEAMVRCHRRLKDGPPQSDSVPHSIPGVSSARALQAPDRDPGVGGAFLPLSSSPQPHPGAWGDRGTHSRRLPAQPGLCLLLDDGDVALGRTGCPGWSPPCRCLLLSARPPSFLTNRPRGLCPSAHPEDTANETPWGRLWGRHPQPSAGRRGFNAGTPTRRRRGLSCKAAPGAAVSSWESLPAPAGVLREGQPAAPCPESSARSA